MRSEDMNIYVDAVGNVTVVTIVGELDGSTAGPAQHQILPLIQPGVRVLLDMTNLEYMSSAGARTLLLIYRQIRANEGDVVLAGLRPEIEDMLAVTGFLEHFTVAATVDDSLAMFGE
jgi:anti-sigma B factor antagonist